jgi:hypothetical protein
VQKRNLLHVCGFNLQLPMRPPIGAGTPKGAAEGQDVLLFHIQAHDCAVPVLITASSNAANGQFDALVIAAHVQGVCLMTALL